MRRGARRRARNGSLVPRIWFVITAEPENMPLTCRYVEPPIGIEPMTYALRGTRDLAAHALTAPMAPVIALMALAALGLSGNPVHKPVHEQEAVARPSDPFKRPWSSRIGGV